MREHRFTFQDLIDWQEGRLEAAPRSELEEHLASGCPICEADLAWLQRFASARQTEAPPAVPERVLARAKTIFDSGRLTSREPSARPTRWLRRPIPLVGTLLAIITILVLCATLTPNLFHQKALLATETGVAEAQLGETAQWTPLDPGESISHGVHIRAVQSPTSLTLFDGSSLQLSPGSHIALASLRSSLTGKPYEILIDQQAGSVQYNVATLPDARSSFQVQTPSTKITVWGTSFVVSITGDRETKVRVIEGRVLVASEQSSVDLESTQSVQVLAGGEIMWLSTFQDSSLDQPDMRPTPCASIPASELEQDPLDDSSGTRSLSDTDLLTPTVSDTPILTSSAVPTASHTPPTSNQVTATASHTPTTDASPEPTVSQTPLPPTLVPTQWPSHTKSATQKAMPSATQSAPREPSATSTPSRTDTLATTTTPTLTQTPTASITLSLTEPPQPSATLTDEPIQMIQIIGIIAETGPQYIIVGGTQVTYDAHTQIHGALDVGRIAMITAVQEELIVRALTIVTAEITRTPTVEAITFVNIAGTIAQVGADYIVVNGTRITYTTETHIVGSLQVGWAAVIVARQTGSALLALEIITVPPTPTPGAEPLDVILISGMISQFGEHSIVIRGQTIAYNDSTLIIGEPQAGRMAIVIAEQTKHTATALEITVIPPVPPDPPN